MKRRWNTWSRATAKPNKVISGPCCRPGGDVFYWWNTSRAAACLDMIVPATFKGTVQCDGYAAYPCFAEGRQGAIILAGCWAHVRRGFYEAREQSPKVSGWFLRQIQNLYRIESVLRDKKAGPALREAVRAHQSRPIVERIERALVRFKTIGRFLPKSLLAEAIELCPGPMACPPGVPERWSGGDR